MRVEKWLVVSSRGNVEVKQRTPTNLGLTEVALRLVLDLPDALFRRPVLSAEVTVDPSTVQPVSEVQRVKIEDAIRLITDLDIKVSVTGPEPEPEDRLPVAEPAGA